MRTRRRARARGLCSRLSARLAAATFTVTNTSDSGRRLAPPGDHRRERRRGHRHDRLQRLRRGLRRLRRLHDHAGDAAADDHQPGPHRRLHAVRLLWPTPTPRARSTRSSRSCCRERPHRPTGLQLTTGADGSTIRGLVINGGWNYAISFVLRRQRRRGAGLLHRHRRRRHRGARLAQHPRDRLRVQRQFHGRRTVAGRSQPRSPATRSPASPSATAPTDSSRATSSGPTSRAPPCSAAPPSRASAVRTNARCGDSGQRRRRRGRGTPGRRRRTTPATGKTILHNWVGTDVTGTINLGTTSYGIFIQGQDIQIGGIGPGEGNVVAFNDGAGVLVGYSTINTFHNPIRGNSIYGNGTAQWRQSSSRPSASISGTRAASARAADAERPRRRGHRAQPQPELPDADVGRLRGRQHDDRRSPEQHGEHPVRHRLLFQRRLRRTPAGLPRGHGPTSAPRT